MKQLLEVSNLSYAHQEGPLLKDISLTLNTGEILGIVGPNGGGKSTLLKLIVDPSPVLSAGSIKRFTDKIGFVPQYIELNETLPYTVKDFFELFIAKKQVQYWLELLKLADKENVLLSKLSGGERQRVILGKALMREPELVILDEPNTGLDAQGVDILYQILNQRCQEKSLGVILVDHDLNRLISHCDNLLCLNKTSHWHNSKKLVTKETLEDIYHCELEHLILHEQAGPSVDHKQCEHHPEGHKEDL